MLLYMEAADIARRNFDVKGTAVSLRGGSVAGFLFKKNNRDGIGDSFAWWVIHAVFHRCLHLSFRWFRAGSIAAAG